MLFANIAENYQASKWQVYRKIPGSSKKHVVTAKDTAVLPRLQFAFY